MNAVNMYEWMPELQLIEDETLRRQCAETWEDALVSEGWLEKGIDKCPMSVSFRCPEHVILHCRHTALAAMAIYESMREIRADYGEISPDRLIAGALLHDVGKLVEFDLDDAGTPCVKTRGRMFRHPGAGAYYAKKHGLPDAVVHAILAHSGGLSPEGSKAWLTPEALIIKHADLICYHYIECFVVDGPDPS
jgi:putative nucleotidyltransferase with HDIG domain